MEISLSILNMNFNHIKEQLKQIQKNVRYLHMDVMDGHFVPNISFGAPIIQSISKENNFIIDTHLMISNPLQYIESFIDAGSNYITFHQEAVLDVLEVIQFIHSKGAKAGISIKPNTSIEKIEPYLNQIDLVLIMSVEPGFGGQSFIEESIEKVKYLRYLKEKKQYSYKISIDGGINDRTLPKVVSYIDLAVVGSYVTMSENPQKKIETLLNIL